MRYLEFLAEETADDLFRKIKALDAMMSPTAGTTDAEKENAANLKATLQQKLQANYPNAKPSQEKPQDAGWTTAQTRTGSWDTNFWAGVGKAAREEKERHEYWAKHPGVEKEYWANKLHQLKARRTEFYRTMVPGDVYNKETMDDYNNKIDDILSKHFPEEWQAELAKREKKREAGWKYQAKKDQEKKDALNKEVKKQKEKGGLGKFTEVYKDYSEVLDRLYEKVKKMKMQKYRNSTFGGLFKKSRILDGLDALAIADIRNVWNALPPDDQIKVKEAVSKVNTLGYNANGYTVAQKERILDAMRPSKAPPRKDYDAIRKQAKDDTQAQLDRLRAEGFTTKDEMVNSHIPLLFKTAKKLANSKWHKEFMTTPEISDKDKMRRLARDAFYEMGYKPVKEVRDAINSTLTPEEKVELRTAIEKITTEKITSDRYFNVFKKTKKEHMLKAFK